MSTRSSSKFLPHFMATLLAATLLVAPMPAQAATVECQVTSSADSGANTLRSCLSTFVSTNSDLRITFPGASVIELDSPIAITTNFSGSPTLNLEIRGPIQIKPSGSFLGTDALIDITTAEVMSVLFNGVTMTDATTGALDVSASSTGSSLRLESSNFLRNTFAGAVTSNLAVTVVGGLFQGNASTDGGAIYGQKIISITDATFRSNTATGDGGAIWTGPGQTLTVTNAYFESNTAVSDGGGIYAHTDGDYGNADIVQVSVNNSTFIANEAEDDEGGAIYAQEDITINLSEFEGNTAYYDGGAVHSLDGDVTVTSSRFEGNRSEDEDGGAIWADYVDVTDSVFIENYASYYGGALRSNLDSTIRGSLFVSNQAGEDGGAIYSEDDSEVFSSTFQFNSAGNDGGAIRSDEDALLVASVFLSNVAGSDGGVLDADEDAVVIDSHFDSNRSGTDGGALYIDEYLEVSRSSFWGNHAGEDGGAIATSAIEDHDSLVAYSSFIGNSSESDGGAISSFYGPTWLAFNTFVDNEAPELGQDVEMHDDDEIIAIGNIFGSSGGVSSPRIYHATFTDLGGNLSTGSEPGFSSDSSRDGLSFSALNLSADAQQSNGTIARVPVVGSAAQGAVSQTEYDAYIAAFFTNGPFNLSDLYLDDNQNQFIVDQAQVAPSAPFTAGSISTLSAGVIYTGPVVTNDPETAQSGSTVTYTGSDLDEVTSATIAGQSAAIVSKTSSALTLRVPAGLAQGMHDVILHYSTTESLTLQNGLVVQDLMKVWTQMQSDNTVKMYAKNIVGEGKIQFFHNNQEIAWVRATNALNPKLRQANGSSYLVRTRELVAGKNAFEIYQDGKRIWRAAYSN